MKKLSLKASALESSEVLTRGQLKKITGGLSDQCIITTNEPNGGTTVTTLTYTGWSCSAMSADAGIRASEQQISLGGHTTYDCGCDGWGS
ncbi:hypothetical protein [Pedobacter nutrimenti]|uniref:hypothetical protein n=1 Tax=Pedobacter nutrimenti TaxID=1241337 RepID=UPI00292DC972|nr:hypothetical protein [Pedobacter nutrimenti]